MSQSPNFFLQPLTCLKGLGPKQAEVFARLGVRNLEQLLFHLPLRYEDHTQRRWISEARAGEFVLLQAQVLSAQIVPGKKPRLQVVVSDGTGQLTLTWFYFAAARLQQFRPGSSWRITGTPRPGWQGIELHHPNLTALTQVDQAISQPSFVPVYPSTEQLSQSKIINAIEQALLLLAQHELADDLPAPLLAERQLPSLQQALLAVHRPSQKSQIQAMEQGRTLAIERLAISELFAHHLSLRKLRQQVRHQPGFALPRASQSAQGLLQSLPFQLTQAQQRVLVEIDQDLTQARPMQRLVQGDVGSGKTLVAALAMLRAVDHGMQAALMAPTEILAEQHFHNFCQWLEPMGIEVVLLLGRLSKAEKRQALARCASGQGQLVIGTHALFQDEVQFKSLGLVVMDEQHRFGVEQRLSLLNKGLDELGRLPHQLSMTATPIPRTLAMTLWGDLDCSVIDELPPGRKPIVTRVITSARRFDVMERIEQAVAAGSQAYWVNTLIENSEQLDSQAAEETLLEMQAALPGLRVGLVHGKQKGSDKQRLMQAFKAKDLDVLVATTVIEVGVDVPNANIMVIENAERLGLSQLHQLRGRVGRGGKESFCVLLFQGPLSANSTARLKAMRESQDGFYLSEKDLELRGPGEVLGRRQTGLVHMRVADLERDADLLPWVQQQADVFLQAWPAAADALIERWLAGSQDYAQA